jgi:DNA-binding MarR family transcriptional regulator
MHAAFFGLKRAYWGSLRVTRKPLAALGLTAARFDLLYVLREAPCPPVAQRAIHRKLGVTPPVVSRMLKSLYELGLVRRERRPGDRRQWLISLTARGRFAIRDAVDRFIRRGRVERIVEHGLCPAMTPGLEREDAAFLAMTDLETLLDNLREGFRARGTLYYPWHPDD